MSGNLSDYLNDDCLALSRSQWPLAPEDSDNWSNESTHSLEVETEPSSLNTSRDPSPQSPWQSPPMRLDSPPPGFMAKQHEPRLSEVVRLHIADLFTPLEADYTVEYQDSYVMPPLSIVSPDSDYSLAGPLPSAYFNSPPMTATTAGIEVAMPRPSKNYQSVLADRFAAGTPQPASPDMHVRTVAHVPGYANEPVVIQTAGSGPSSARTEPTASRAAAASQAAGPSTKAANRKRRADSAGSSDSSLSPTERKKVRKVYDDALAAASVAPPGTKNYPKRLTTPYQAFLDQLVLPVLKRISEPTKWLVVGGARSPAFGKLLWERLDEDVKKAWFDQMNVMREEWNRTAPEDAQCPVQPKPKPETLPKIGKTYREVLGHIEPLVIAFFAGVEHMMDLMPGGQPNIDQEAMERAAQGKADVLGFGDDAKGGPLKAGVKPPGTIVMGPSAVAKGENTSSGRAVRPLPKARITKNSRQALAEQLVPVEVPRSFRCGFVAGGDADRNLGSPA